MLSTLGEAPVQTLEGPLTADVGAAMNILDNTNKAIQLRGWASNTEDNYPLTPIASGEILMPPNVLRPLFPEGSGQKLVVRGGKLYDLVNHSYQFSSDITASLVFLLNFEDLTETLRHYVTVCASRKFQQSVMGSDTLHRFSEEDEGEALVLALQEDCDMRGSNFKATFQDGWDAMEIIRR